MMEEAKTAKKPTVSIEAFAERIDQNRNKLPNIYNVKENGVSIIVTEDLKYAMQCFINRL